MNHRLKKLHIFFRSCEHVERMKHNAIKKDLNHSSYGKMAGVHQEGRSEEF
jgi:hypothetical protein